MKKPKLGARIEAAIRALRGEPFPAISVPTLPKLERHNIQTFACQHVTSRYFDERAPEGTAESVAEGLRKSAARQLVQDLLRTGAIEVTTEPARPELYGPDAGTIYLAKIRVVMPEKEDAAHG